MLHFTGIKLVTRVLACARAIARIKWKLFMEFMETAKNSKIKNKVKYPQRKVYEYQKDKQVCKYQRSLQIYIHQQDTQVY